ncbi:unnamed protein product [Cylicocyclus nassatus]|uniref:Apple domain-containing protein n=1 Tax=Cylicocyclus nassatus TaxID=53992 RepID=A0AA36H559_CYLNA|nr:unnamed protein product [Cylicocyclus nassatus]
MMPVVPAQMWMVIVVTLSQSSNSLQCTFTKVSGVFNLSLIATYNGTAEPECFSKCSVDKECTFLDYNEGLCRTFKSGSDVHELGFNSQAFAYSYEMMDTTCRTEMVSKPRLNLQTTTPKHAYPCSDGSDYDIGEALIKGNLLEAPDNLTECWFDFMMQQLEAVYHDEFI